MIELFIVVFLSFVGFMLGGVDMETMYQEKCVAKYSYMPHSEVGPYCKTLLKFEKEVK